MIAYYAQCTSCGTSSRHTEPRAAITAANTHVCTGLPLGVLRCESCGGGTEC